MTIYSFFIFDRHTECIYQRRWTQTPVAPTSNGDSKRVSRYPQRSQADDAKLIFGVIFSLRNMVQRLGGEDDEFISYRTGEYKLHYYETPTSMKFVMLTDIRTNNLRVVLHQIWVNLYVEYVVRNPLAPVEHPGGIGVNNELFEMGLDRFVGRFFHRSFAFCNRGLMEQRPFGNKKRNKSSFVCFYQMYLEKPKMLCDAYDR